MEASLYQRLGGRIGINAIVSNLVRRHQENPLIQTRFAKVDCEQLERHVAEFFCAGSGGHEQYTGQDMVTAHAGMNLHAGELIAAMDDVLAAMQANGAGQREQQEVLAILYSLKGDVLHK